MEALEKEQEPNGTVWDCTLIKIMRENKDTVVNPIYEWSDSDVWDYLNRGGYKHNPMYDMGYHRVGCIGCPLATYKQKMKEFADFPTYKEHYIKAFEQMLEEKRKKGWHNNNKWDDGRSVYDWWIQKDNHIVRGQMTLADYDVDSEGFIIRERIKNE